MRVQGVESSTLAALGSVYLALEKSPSLSLFRPLFLSLFVSFCQNRKITDRLTGKRLVVNIFPCIALRVSMVWAYSFILKIHCILYLK